jgi:hypothetical protein
MVMILFQSVINDIFLLLFIFKNGKYSVLLPEMEVLTIILSEPYNFLIYTWLLLFFKNLSINYSPGGAKPGYQASLQRKLPRQLLLKKASRVIY